MKNTTFAGLLLDGSVPPEEAEQEMRSKARISGQNEWTDF